MNAEKICHEWRKNPLVNPETKRAIKADGPKYKELQKLCKDKASPPKGKEQSPPQGKEQSPPKGSPNSGISDICKKWFENKGVNPRTGAGIKVGGPTYLKLEKECGKGATSAKKPEPAPPSSLASKTVNELRVIAKNEEIKGYSKMKKEDLINRITEKQRKKTTIIRRKKIKITKISFSPAPQPKKDFSPPLIAPIIPAPIPITMRTPSIPPVPNYVPQTPVVPKATMPVVSQPKAPTPVVPKATTPVVSQPKATMPVVSQPKDLTDYIFQLVFTKKISLDPCTLTDRLGAMLKKVEGKLLSPKIISLSKTSFARSVSVDITLNDDTKLRAFLKIWFTNIAMTKRVESPLDYEREVYIYITQNIIKTNQSPNFIPLLAASLCPLTTKFNLSEDLNIWVPKAFAQNPGSKFNVILTASSPNIESFYDFSKKPSLTIADKSSIVFQLFHALYCLSVHRINHLDLHPRNILIETLREPICFRFVVGSNQVTFLTKYVVKIFDFDMANVEKLGTNPVYMGRDNFDILYNNPQVYKEDRDLYQILCELLSKEHFRDLVTELLPSKTLTHEKMSYEKVKEFKISLSKTTLDKISKETPANVKGDLKTYLLPVDRLKIILNPVEFQRLEAGIPKIELMQMLFFIVKNDTLRVGKGWFCQMLHVLKKDLYYPVKNYFTDKALFDRLTARLDKQGVPEKTFVI
jgi:serine/threonine protein kinase